MSSNSLPELKRTKCNTLKDNTPVQTDTYRLIEGNDIDDVVKHLNILGKEGYKVVNVCEKTNLRSVWTLEKCDRYNYSFEYAMIRSSEIEYAAKYLNHYNLQGFKVINVSRTSELQCIWTMEKVINKFERF